MKLRFFLSLALAFGAMMLGGCAAGDSGSTKAALYGGPIAAIDAALSAPAPQSPQPQTAVTKDTSVASRQRVQLETLLGRYQAPPQVAEYPPYNGRYSYDPKDFYYNNHYFDDPNYQPYPAAPAISTPGLAPRNDNFQGYTSGPNPDF